MNKYLKDLSEDIKANPLNYFVGVLWGSNEKIGAIASVNFETAINCSSNERGYCPLSSVCYALSDYKQYKGHKARTIKTAQTMAIIREDSEIFELFIKTLRYFKVDVLRYNLVGDFSSVEDIKLLLKIHESIPNLKIYGYSKRYDLRGEIIALCSHKNIFCGVPEDLKGNSEVLNIFESVEDIERWHKHPLKCLGDCNKCKKCYTLKGEHIICFIHGSPSKIQKRINTPQNFAYCIKYINECLGLSLPIPTTKAKGFFVRHLNEILEANGYKVPYTFTERGAKTYTLKTVKDIFKFCEFGGF